MSIRPYYGPNEDHHTIYFEKYFLAGDFVSGVGYGVQLMLWTSCVLYLWQQRKSGRHTTVLLCYITFILIVQTIYVIVQARTVELMYIDNRNYPGGPWKYFLDTQHRVNNVLYYVMVFIATSMCDTLVLWRCWVIWTASGARYAYFVIAGPFIILIASFAMGMFWAILSSHRGLSLYSKRPQTFGIAYYSLSLGVNILLTILIVLRLLIFRRTHAVHLSREHARQYLSIVALIVESASLYSVFSLAFLLSYGLDWPINQVWQSFAYAAQPIATYLIIYRVAEGKAWSRKAVHKDSLSSMNFRRITASPHHDNSTTQSSPAESIVVRVDTEPDLVPEK